ncbi:CopG family transcriptional regulator [Pararhizobium sp.]|uniref:ribbon-helix-helix domain-containing protein n=1 Tax=Pararhizobium sp. TaxID=1977563 RepID=UPI0027275C96|nr:CopG family transcriptional regulator [Pararhizobium sp.]MDO9415177.1 CopG family transcriptional regulator [Pararhizobium sp.]
MRTLIDIDDMEIQALDAIARKEKVSRASLIRKAVNDFLKLQAADDAQAFGLWGDRAVDGLVYQHEIRREW